jgi:diketogulonate reductase-like aldo/keto reductase
MEHKKLGRSDTEIPVIGMGTWNVAPPDTYAPSHVDEPAVIEALKAGIEMGLTHIDTAEMYGDGRAEKLVGKAIRGKRDRIFVATKVEPEHFHYDGVLAAARESLKRLGTDYIDLYQLHWPTPSVPTKETMRAMEHLVDEGIVRFIGVSNFSVPQLRQAQEALSRYQIVSNQAKYNLLARGIERELLPFAQREEITIIAYSPFDTGYLFRYSGSGVETVSQLSKRYNKTFAQICLNWLIAKGPVVTIPKAVQISHLRENADAQGWRMEAKDHEAIGNAFGQ